MLEMIRHCDEQDFEAIYQIVNDGATAYRGVIPADCWAEPYMPREELREEIGAGVVFWGYEEDGALAGVMGIQQVRDVTLIRHAYVRSASQRRGIGVALLASLEAQTDRPVLIGTWADAVWAIRFYEKQGFRLVSPEEKDRLLRRYWTVNERQIETSVVLAAPAWFESQQEAELRSGAVTSRDGTSIAYDRQGRGPALILVGGGLVDPATGRGGRWENAPLAAELAEHFTVYNYDRRGREKSGDTLPYAVERELEDLDALIGEAGGSAHLYGVSSGGALAMEAAAAGSTIDRLAVYEVPYMTGDEMSQHWREYVEQLEAALAEDRRGDAVELFMRVAGSSEEQIARARSSPMWPGLETIAHTLAYDAACLGDGLPPLARLAEIRQPTLVATGGAADFFEQAADAIAGAIPHAERLIIEGQGHVAEPKTVAAVLERFFRS
jgi:pimeloyl-ACP methyl ester carboxylesterase/GNAT superfamily N-acetyltransferase